MPRLTNNVAIEFCRFVVVDVPDARVGVEFVVSRVGRVFCLVVVFAWASSVTVAFIICTMDGLMCTVDWCARRTDVHDGWTDVLTEKGLSGRRRGFGVFFLDEWVVFLRRRLHAFFKERHRERCLWAWWLGGEKEGEKAMQMGA